MNRSLPLLLSWMCAVCVAVFALACTVGEPVTKGSPDATAGHDANAGGGNAGGMTDSGSPVPDASEAVDVGSLPDAGSVNMARDGGTRISPQAFGQNYWDWVDWSKNGITGLTGTETLVTALHLNVLRAGGNNNDSNSPQPFGPAEIDKYVAYCRTVGAEPILQVPIIANNTDGGAATPQTAADMVTYANVTKGYGIRYWEIGNEPDLYSTTYDSGVPLTAADYCTLFARYATAMKTANAAAADGGVPLQLVGPDLSWKYIPGNDWLTPFLDGCKDYVDVVSIHRYPFSAAMLSPGGALTDANKFRSVLTGVRAIVQAHARAGVPLAVTETNVSYDYDPAKYTGSSVQAEPGTFYAALWAADAIGVALENDVWALAFWNLGEIDTTGSVLGSIVGGQPVPTYYAQQLFSAHFRGNVVVPKAAPPGFSVYASHDAAGATTSVVVLNKAMLAKSLTLDVDGVAPQSLNCPGLSMTLAEIPDAPAAATHIWQYTADMAAANLAPKQLQ